APMPMAAMRMADADVVFAVDLNGPPADAARQAAEDAAAQGAGSEGHWWLPRRRAGHEPRVTRPGLGFVDLMMRSLDVMQSRMARGQLAMDPARGEAGLAREGAQIQQ